MERLRFIKRGFRDKIWEGEVEEHSNLVTVGHNPRLIAALVNDLTIVESGSIGPEDVMWTEQPVKHMGMDNKIHTRGCPIRRKFHTNLSKVTSSSWEGVIDKSPSQNQDNRPPENPRPTG
jgi:hypothetical protein